MMDFDYMSKVNDVLQIVRRSTTSNQIFRRDRWYSPEISTSYRCCRNNVGETREEQNVSDLK